MDAFSFLHLRRGVEVSPLPKMQGLPEVRAHWLLIQLVQFPDHLWRNCTDFQGKFS